MEQIGILTRSAKPSYARSACSNYKSNAHNFIKQHIALHFMIAVFALLLNLQEKMIDLDARSQFCRQLCHSNDHPSKTQSIHHRLLVMLFTLSSVLASLKKFREEVSECPICLEPCTDTLVSPKCNRRFCGKCIKESLHKCNHECPTCRAHVPTYIK